MKCLFLVDTAYILSTIVLINLYNNTTTKNFNGVVRVLNYMLSYIYVKVLDVGPTLANDIFLNNYR